jgi:SAM-dependent methyltransferase
MVEKKSKSKTDPFLPSVALLLMRHLPLRFPFPQSFRSASEFRVAEHAFPKSSRRPPVSSSQLATTHWNKAPLLYSERERYSAYPWLTKAAEFDRHKGERVLEIGCGTGCDLLQFAAHGAFPVGIDITPEHLRLARERVGNLAEVVPGDGANIPFVDASFDYVYSHGVLHHVDKPRRMVHEIFRVLRPGGRFSVHVYALWSYWPALLILKHGRNWKLWIENSRDPVKIELYSARKLRRLFAPANVSLEKFGFENFSLLAPFLGWFLVAKGQRP